MITFGWLVLAWGVGYFTGTFVTLGLQRRLKRAPLKSPVPAGLRWADFDEIQPATRDAYERGMMTNEQMVEMLRACGNKVSLKDGKLVADE